MGSYEHHSPERIWTIKNEVRNISFDVCELENQAQEKFADGEYFPINQVILVCVRAHWFRWHFSGLFLLDVTFSFRTWAILVALKWLSLVARNIFWFLPFCLFWHPFAQTRHGVSSLFLLQSVSSISCMSVGFAKLALLLIHSRNFNCLLLVSSLRFLVRIFLTRFWSVFSTFIRHVLSGERWLLSHCLWIDLS